MSNLNYEAEGIGSLSKQVYWGVTMRGPRVPRIPQVIAQVEQSGGPLYVVWENDCSMMLRCRCFHCFHPRNRPSVVSFDASHPSVSYPVSASFSYVECMHVESATLRTEYPQK